MSASTGKWKRISTQGAIFEFSKKNPLLAGVIESFNWAGEGKNAFPTVQIVQEETGEQFSLRTDVALLRVVERIPEGTPVRIRFTGTKKSRFKTPMKLFDVEIPNDVRMEEIPFSERVARPQRKNPNPNAKKRRAK